MPVERGKECNACAREKVSKAKERMLPYARDTSKAQMFTSLSTT